MESRKVKNDQRWEKMRSLISKMIEEGEKVVAFRWDKEANAVQFLGAEQMHGYAMSAADDFMAAAQEKASATEPFIEKELKLDIHTNVHKLRKQVGELVKMDVYKRTGVKRGFWGFRNMAPEWYPQDIPFVSPHDNTKKDRPVMAELRRILTSYIHYCSFYL